MVHNRIRKIESAGKNSGAAVKLFMLFCTPRLALPTNIPLELMRILSFFTLDTLTHANVNQCVVRLYALLSTQCHMATIPNVTTQ